MSSQRSDWPERLHANPSRMELELATKLQEDRINFLTQVEIIDSGLNGLEKRMFFLKVSWPRSVERILDG